MSLIRGAPFGELLTEFRKRRRLSQGKLAERLGVHRNTISLWERGEYLPETLASISELAQALQLDEEEIQQLLEARFGTSTLRSFHNVPFPRNPFFFAVDDLLPKLHQALTSIEATQRVQALVGMVGVGKTQIALEYAYQQYDFYHDIFWARANSMQDLTDSFVEFALSLNLLEGHAQDTQRAILAVQRWLMDHSSWLLILDAVQDLRLVYTFVPARHRGAILLTTCQQVTEPIARAFPVNTLTEQESVLFLARRTQHPLNQTHIERLALSERIAARDISVMLGGLPLALDQVGAYILETQSDIATYLKLLHAHQYHLLQRRGRQPINHQYSVVEAFDALFTQLSAQHAAAFDFLQLCAVLSPESIPDALITQGAAFLGPNLQQIATDLLLWNEIIEVLGSYSLIQHDNVARSVLLPKPIQAMMLHTMTEDNKVLWIGRALEAMNAIMPALSVEPSVQQHYVSQQRRYYAHTEFCTLLMMQNGFFIPAGVHLLLKVGFFLLKSVRYQMAECFLSRAHELLKQRETEYPQESVIALYFLALLEHEQGRCVEAEVLYQQALVIHSDQNLAEDRYLAFILVSLARLWIEQGRLAPAEMQIRRAYKISEQLSGTYHPDTASCLSILASWYYHQERYGEAEASLQHALRLFEYTLGAKHSRVIANWALLSMIYFAQHRSKEAETLLRRALQQYVQEIGSDYPDVASMFGMLARMLCSMGRYDEAEECAQRSVTIFERVLGHDHPRLGEALAIQAKVVQEQGHYERAEHILLQALMMSEKQVGRYQPVTASYIHSLALLYLASGNLKLAEDMLRRSLAIYEVAQNALHPGLLLCQEELILLLLERDQHEEAILLLQALIRLKEQRYGYQHAETLKSISLYQRLQECEAEIG